MRVFRSSRLVKFVQVLLFVISSLEVRIDVNVDGKARQDDFQKYLI